MKRLCPLLLLLALLAFSATNAQQKCGTTPIAPDLTQGTYKAVNGSMTINDIVGGAVATAYSWPWQIVWCGVSGSQCSLMCGGSVIAPNWIMTAGHCVYGYTNQPGSFRVKTGVFDESQNNENGEVVHRVTQIVLHPQYTQNPNPDNDIALVQVSDTINYTSQVQPICLPSTDSGIAAPPGTAWATGWGTTSSGGSISRNLRQVQVPFVSQTTCNSDYEGEVSSAMVCAGRQGKDSCQGDSGGPLVVQNPNGYWFQYGITSWGYGCALAGYPGVYGRVSQFCSFISSTTNGDASCVNPNTYS